MSEEKSKGASTGKKLGYGCLGILAFLFVVGVIAGVGNKNNTNTTATSQPAPPDKATSQTTETQTPTSKPTATPSPMVLLDISGSGTKTTQKFTAAGDWDLSWSYDCSNFGTQGNFQVDAYNEDGSPSFDINGVNQLGKSGSDVEHYHKGGTYYLTVNSECKWHITTKG